MSTNTQKRGLGRGLGALIPGAPPPHAPGTPATPSETPPTHVILDVPLTAIVPNPRQPRTLMAEDDLAELAASIEEHGIIQPLIVTRIGDDQFQLIAGERRWRASQRAGLATVPVIVKEVTPQELLELALVENIQRADLNALEEALAYRQMIEEFGLTQEQVAKRVGKSRVAISNTVRLLALADPLKEALMQGVISEGHARALLGLPAEEAQIAALQTVLAQDYTVRETEEYVQRLRGERPVQTPKAAQPEVRALEERLVERLGTHVQLKHGKRGGRVVIRYYSDEELNAVCDKILGPGWEHD